MMSEVRFDAPVCERCCGTGLDPVLDVVDCWRCAGRGDEPRRSALRLRFVVGDEVEVRSIFLDLDL